MASAIEALFTVSTTLLSRVAVAGNREQIAVCLPPGSRPKFRAVAAQLNVSISGLLRAALVSYLENHPGNQLDHSPVADALAALTDPTFRHGGRGRPLQQRESS